MLEKFMLISGIFMVSVAVGFFLSALFVFEVGDPSDRNEKEVVPPEIIAEGVVEEFGDGMGLYALPEPPFDKRRLKAWEERQEKKEKRRRR